MTDKLPRRQTRLVGNEACRDLGKELATMLWWCIACAWPHGTNVAPGDGIKSPCCFGQGDSTEDGNSTVVSSTESQATEVTIFVAASWMNYPKIDCYSITLPIVFTRLHTKDSHSFLCESSWRAQTASPAPMTPHLALQEYLVCQSVWFLCLVSLTKAVSCSMCPAHIDLGQKPSNNAGSRWL